MLVPLALAAFAPTPLALSFQGTPDPTPTSLLADLDLSPFTPPPGLSGSNMQVLGTAAGRLWLRAERSGVGTLLWSLDAADADPEPWFLGPDSNDTIAAGRVDELGPDLVLVDVQSDFESLRGTYALQPSTVTWTRLSPRALADVVVEGPTAYLLLREGQNFATSPHSLVATDGTLGGTVTLDELPRRPIFSGLNAAQASLHPLPQDLVYATTQGGTTTVFAQPKAGGSPAAVGTFPGTTFDAGSTGSRVVFNAVDATSGAELWATDGTPGGTQLVADLVPGASGSSPQVLASLAGEVLIGATTGAIGREPYISDGTAAGTRLLADLTPGTGGGLFSAAVPFGGEFYFGYDPPGFLNGPVLYGTTGGAAGVQPATPSGVSVGPSAQTLDLRGTPLGVLFNGTSNADTGPWLSQGTPATTFPLVDFQSAQAPVSTLPGAGFDGRLWFPGTDSEAGRELYSAAPAPATAVLTIDLAPTQETASSLPSDFSVALGQTFFRTGGFGGETLFVTDATAGGTLDLSAAPFGQVFALGATLGTGLFFVANDDSDSIFSGAGAWFTDGTVAGTRFLGVEEGGSGSAFGASAALGSRIVFAGPGSGGGPTLYSTDGTLAGTAVLLDLPLPSNFVVTEMVRLQDRLWFSVRSQSQFSSDPPELWSTAGDAASTQAEFTGGFATTVLTDLTPVGDRLFFRERVDNSPFGDLLDLLWATDPAGPVLVDAFEPAFGNDPAWLLPGRLTAAGDRLVVSAPRRAIGVDASTLAVEPLLEAFSENAALPTASRGEGALAYLRVLRREGPAEPTIPLGLYATDGTAAGTVHLGPATDNARVIGSDGLAVFSNSTPATGPEPWITDGTPAGTRLLADTIPGLVGSGPRFIGGFALEAPSGRRGTTALFLGFDSVSGSELHALPLIPEGAFLARPFGTACAAGATPRLDLGGDLRVGQLVTLDVDQAAPLSPVRFYGALQPTAVPLGGCTLYLADPFVLLEQPTDAAGASSTPVALPADPVLVGLELYLQAANLTPGGGFAGVANLTNALELVIGSAP